MLYTIINNFYFFIKIYFFSNLQRHKMFKKFFLLSFSKNEFFSTRNTSLLRIPCFSFLNKSSNFKKVLYILSNLFFLNKNVVFVDNNINYNYLPINNDLIFNRSFKKLSKIIQYFDITMVFYIDLKKKKFIFKKLYNCNLININVSSSFVSRKFDLSLNFTNNYAYTYLFYLSVMNIYLKIKNN